MDSIFTYNKDIRKNAYLNWTMREGMDAANFFSIANGYSMAAICLMEQLLNDNSSNKADKVIFPILYNANQSIELYLKASLRLVSDTTKGHDLSELLHIVAQSYKQYINKDMNNDAPHLKQYIDNLIIVIGTNPNNRLKIDFSRYPKDTSENDFFYVIHPTNEDNNSEIANNAVIDIEKYLSIFKQIVQEIEGIYYTLEEKISKNS